LDGGSSPSPLEPGAIVFGTGDRLRTTGNFDINQDVTFGFWIYGSFTGTHMILSVQLNSITYWLLIRRTDQGTGLVYQVDTAAAAGARFGLSGTNQDVDGAWHYVYVWREYSTVATDDLWGVQIDDGTKFTTARSAFVGGDPGAAMPAGLPLYVGSRVDGAVPLIGMLSHLTIWFSVLDDAVRTENYDAELGTLP
jgi:hypothetical protein